MKNTNIRLGRPLAAERTQVSKRLAALTARRTRQGLRHFMESMNGGMEFASNRSLSYPVG